MKHAPGPWKLCFHLQSKENDESCPCGFRGDIWAADGEHIVCSIGEPEHLRGLIEPIDRETEIVNAHLIAAAPELLQMLELTRAFWAGTNAAPRVEELLRRISS